MCSEFVAEGKILWCREESLRNKWQHIRITLDATPCIGNKRLKISSVSYVCSTTVIGSLMNIIVGIISDFCKNVNAPACDKNTKETYST